MRPRYALAAVFPRFASLEVARQRVTTALAAVFPRIASLDVARQRVATMLPR